MWNKLGFIYEFGKARLVNTVMTIHVSAPSTFGEKISKILLQREQQYVFLGRNSSK